MTAEDALNRHFSKSGIYPKGCTRADWYPGHLVSLKFGSVSVPMFPILRRDGPIVLHDLHHMLAGYPPTWRGEAELAAWEIGSGGCRWHVLYWLDRLTFLLGGLLAAPVATWRAFARGTHCRNLFGRDVEAVLATDVDKLAGFVGAYGA
jgi:hypothetical protein